MAWTRRPIDLQSAYTIVSRRTCLTFAAVAALGLCVQAPAHAQTMTAPEGSIEITVGSGPGATPDVIMRRVAKILNEDKIVTNPIVVQNRTGGGWTVAANYVLGHPGNKNILFGVVPTVYATPIVQGLPNTYEKVTPLAMLARIDLLVVVRADSPYKTLADFVKAAKEKERALSMAGANVGSTDHIVNALIEKAGGVKLNYVPFDGGGGQVISSLLGGVVTAVTLPPDEAMPLLQGGKARAIAVLSEQRLTEPSLKDIPTAREQGVDVIWGQYYGIAGPPQLDPSVVAWWQDKFTKMVATPAWAAMMKDMYLTSAYVPANEARPAMDKVYQGFASVLSDLGLAKK